MNPTSEHYQDGAVVMSDPCPWCAVWIGPHVHLLSEDGGIGTLMFLLDLNKQTPQNLSSEAPE